MRSTGTPAVPIPLTRAWQWDSNSLWESRYIWLPMAIDDDKKDLDIVWHDVYDLDVSVSRASRPLLQQ